MTKILCTELNDFSIVLIASWSVIFLNASCLVSTQKSKQEKNQMTKKYTYFKSYFHLKGLPKEVNIF